MYTILLYICSGIVYSMLPKKGEIFTAWLWPHCHNYDVESLESSLADVFEESLMCVMMYVVLATTACFCFLIDVALWIIYSKTLAD